MPGSVGWIAWLVVAICVVAITTLSAIPGRSWVLRICDFPRLQTLIAGLITLLLVPIVLVRGAPGVVVMLAGTLTGAAVLLQMWWCLGLTRFARTEVGRSINDRRESDDDSLNDHSVRVITANVDFMNHDPQAAMTSLVSHKPHLLAIVETDDKWRKAVERLSGAFPWTVCEFRGNGYGMALLSRLPIEHSEIRYLVNQDRPSIWAEVRLPSGALSQVVIVHPPPPGLPRRRGEGRLSSRIRDVELSVVASMIGERPGNRWIVAGDFNDVGWSDTTRRFKRVSGLRDPRIGRGMFATFPSRWPIFRYPIDHVMVSSEYTVDRLSRLDGVGSDHLPLLADLRDEVSPTLEAHDTLTYHACSGDSTEDHSVEEMGSSR